MVPVTSALNQDPRMGTQLAPLKVRNLPRDVGWLDYARRTRLDPELPDLLSRAVYRYMGLSEALTLINDHLCWFNRPSKWSDKYEGHVAKELFSASGPFSRVAAFAKCFSFAFSSEAMWRIYSSRTCLVRLRFTLGDLVSALDNATFAADAKLYVGRVRYMDAKPIRREVEAIAKSNAKPVANQAARALLMKRVGFEYENEIRVCYATESSAVPDDIAQVSNIPTNVISEMLIDPYLNSWEADPLIALLNRMSLPLRITQSAFNSDPGTIV